MLKKKKAKYLHIRITEEDEKIINQIVNASDLNKSDIGRLGLMMLFNKLKK